MKNQEKKIKKVEDPELARIMKKKNRLGELINSGYSEEMAIQILAKEDAQELIEREGTIEGENDRAKAKK